jgi:AcrR family transcriptional regulator
MPRAGVTPAAIVAAGAEIADEVGYGNLTLALIAERLGVRVPSLYKHVDGLPDVQHRIATLATTELGDAIREAILGRSGHDALSGLAMAALAYITAHPGRYMATVGAELKGTEDPLLVASTRVIDAIAAVLRAYGIPEEKVVHAVRAIRSMLHGFGTLQATNGFQWTGDVDETFAWMIDFADAGLRHARNTGPTPVTL